MVSEEICINKKKPSNLHWDNRKDALRTSQELVRLHPSQACGCERSYFFERLSLGKRAPLGHLTYRAV
jgi:hypothetical protein